MVRIKIPGMESSGERDTTLFRSEVLDRKKGTYFGKITAITPISFSVWALGISFIALALIVFLCWGRYAKRQEVHGMLVPSGGLLHVYAKFPGVVVDRLVKQGDCVTKGQPLYLISTEQYVSSRRGVAARQTDLLKRQISIQENRVSTAAQGEELYRRLLDKGAATEAEYRNHYDAYLQSRSALHDLRQKLALAEREGHHIVLAPADGTASTLVAMTGDRVIAEKPLASIIPLGARLHAVLYVPADAIGFVKKGQRVLLKYDAYPYQHFGLYEATVDHVDESVLLPRDLDLPVNINVPFYRAVAHLKQPTVTVYGKPHPLISGITLKASILEDERSILRWIMNPIYGLKGSLTSHE